VIKYTKQIFASHKSDYSLKFTKLRLTKNNLLISQLFKFKAIFWQTKGVLHRESEREVADRIDREWRGVATER